MIVDNLKTIGGIKYIHPKAYFVKGDILEKRVLNKIKDWKPKNNFSLGSPIRWRNCI